MATQLDFAEEFHYSDEPSGITIPTLLTYFNKTVRASAKVDTGADVCLFAREIGGRLGIRVEEGDAISLSSLAGPLEAFGHEVVIQNRRVCFPKSHILCQASRLATQHPWTAGMATQSKNSDH